MLATQSLIAGIGNAYSDEILHVARLSPFKPAPQTRAPTRSPGSTPPLVSVLGRGDGPAVGPEANGAQRATRSGPCASTAGPGEPCPDCGDVVREVSFATKSLQYCATCQTGGKPLADRRLSKLLQVGRPGTDDRRIRSEAAAP